MRKFFTLKALLVFLGYAAVFSVVIQIVLNNINFFDSLKWGIALSVLLFLIDSIRNINSQES